MTGWLIASIRKYSRRAGVGERTDGVDGAPDPATVGASCQQRQDGHFERCRRKTPERVARRPDPGAWAEDELIGLHEAVALLWPDGPVTASTLRTAIAHRKLAYVRIAGKIYTTRADLEAMASCRKCPPAAPRPDAAAREARLAKLLPKRGGSRGA